MLLLTGYRGEQIASYFGNGERFGVEIQCHHGPEDWPTGQRLLKAAAHLTPQFLLLYADNLAPVNLEWLMQRHREAACPVTLTVVNKTPGNLRLTPSGGVDCYDSTRSQPGLTHVEIGYMVVDRDSVLDEETGQGSFALVLGRLAKQRRLAAFEPGVFYHSISDVDRLRLTEACLEPTRVLLLDRDGVLNRKAPRGEYIWKKENFVWLTENVAALEQLSRLGFEFILITNQAGVGRGLFPIDAVEELHAWMTAMLRERGVFLRDIFLCPHHWEENCACRKPLPGLFFAASKKHRFPLDKTFYIGDDERDVLAAWRACCPCVFLHGNERRLSDPEVSPALSFPDLSAGLPDLLHELNKWYPVLS